MKQTSFALLFFLIVGCAWNEAAKPKSRGDSILEAEAIFKAISEGSRSERHKAIESLSNAYTVLTNRTPAQLKLVEMPNTLIVAAWSHPYKNNELAKLWFRTVEVLIDELKTEERERAGVLLNHIAKSPMSPRYDEWSKRWPEIKQRYIGIMDQNKG
jgi:hypothetical protein